MPRRVRFEETTEFSDLHEEHESQSVSNLEVEELLFEDTSEKPRRFSNLPIIAGFGLLGAIILFLLQQIGILPGSGLQDVFIVFPLIGLILVILFGLSPKRRRRRNHASRKARKAHFKRQKREGKARGKERDILGKLEKPKWNFPTKSRKKILAGVCGGLAQHIKMDATLFRVLFILAVLPTGVWILVVAYILLSIFMPSADDKAETSS
ncbi:MAG: PspC domain-containing protein [Bacteroidetes bacterium]|nr:PspC domain-containing protein [Bacteroidota bacterium]